MAAFDPTQIDLCTLAKELVERLGSTPAAGYVVGRTLLRDAVLEAVACSELEAERLVDTMVERGIFRFDEKPGTIGVWVLAR